MSELSPADLTACGIDAVVLGLGFEERTLVSAKRLIDTIVPERVVLIRYDERGHGAEIERLVRDAGATVEILDHRILGPAADPLPPAGRTLVDITGLTKPLIFQSVRRSLVREGRVLVAHTAAERHYPLEEKIEPILQAEASEDIWALLDRLNDVWLGEEGPYTFERLLLTDADESRRRHLIASASPKHQRLLSLVEQREFDRVDVLAPRGDSARDQLARRAALVATRVAEGSDMFELDSDDLAGALERITQTHQRYYVDGNYNFELGLTGSKLHAVAFAAASASMMISQAWYVRPAKFDPERFSIGIGPSRYFELFMPALADTD